MTHKTIQSEMPIVFHFTEKISNIILKKEKYPAWTESDPGFWPIELQTIISLKHYNLLVITYQRLVL